MRPRPRIRPGVVGIAFADVAARSWIREGMHRATVTDHLPVHLGRIQLRRHRRDALGRHIRIIRAMQ